MYGSRHVALVHAANGTTLRPDLLHMVEILEIAYGMSSKSRKLSKKKKGQEVGLDMSKISRWIFMLSTAGHTC